MVTTRTTKQVQNADAKYINAILYFSANANNKWFGTKKLAKMLYELDFDVYEEQGQSLTGDTYVKEKYGPLPKRLDRKSTRLNSSHIPLSRMPSSA